MLAVLICTGYWPIACYLLVEVKRQALTAPKSKSAGLCMKRGHLRKWRLATPPLKSCRARLQDLAEIFIVVSAIFRMCFLTKPERWFMTPLRGQTHLRHFKIYFFSDLDENAPPCAFFSADFKYSYFSCNSSCHIVILSYFAAE